MRLRGVNPKMKGSNRMDTQLAGLDLSSSRGGSVHTKWRSSSLLYIVRGAGLV